MIGLAGVRLLRPEELPEACARALAEGARMQMAYGWWPERYLPEPCTT